MTTEDRAVRGTAISFFGQLISVCLRFASNIILARFLPESAFGLSAMVFALTTGLWLMSDIGIGPSIVRSRRVDDEFIQTAWTLSVLRGAILFGVGCIAGPLLAWFYDEPVLLWLLPLVSFMILLLGAESTLLWVAQRRMHVAGPVIIDIAAQVVALCVSIPLAIYTQHVIAIAAAAIVSCFVKFVLSHLILAGPRMKFLWDKSAINEIFHFGKWIFVSTLFSFVALRWDVFSLGRLEGFALLGVYGFASQIVSVPNQIASQVSTQVLTPILTDAFRGSQDELRVRLAQARRAYVPAAALLFLGAATTAPAFFLIAYRAAFHGAGPMAQVLMVSAWLVFLQEAASRALLAAGDGRGLALANGVRVIATIVATLVGFQLLGFWGFVAAGVVGPLFGLITVGLRLRRHGISTLGSDLVATILLVVVGGAACVAPILLAPQLPGIGLFHFGVGLPGVLHFDSAVLTLGSCVLVCGPLALYIYKYIRR